MEVSGASQPDNGKKTQRVTSSLGPDPEEKLRGWLAVKTRYLSAFFLFSGSLNTARPKDQVTSGQTGELKATEMLLLRPRCQPVFAYLSIRGQHRHVDANTQCQRGAASDRLQSSRDNRLCFLHIHYVNVIRVQLLLLLLGSLSYLPLDSSVQCRWPGQGRSLLVTWHWWRWAVAACTERRQRRPETWGAGRRCYGLHLVLAGAGTGMGQSGVEEKSREDLLDADDLIISFLKTHSLHRATTTQ